MRYGYSTIYSSALVALVFGFATSCDPHAAGSEQGEKRTILASAMQCANGDLGKRSRMFNETTLRVVEKAFVDHFKVELGAGLKDVTGTAIPIDLDELLRLRGSLPERPVAIKVHYGLRGEVFMPVFQFLKLDAEGADVDTMGTYYVVENGVMKKAADTSYDPAQLMAAYRDSIRIDRTGVPNNWDRMNSSSSYPDPVSEWFQFDMELNKLIADNRVPGMRTLVLTCISEPLCYSSTHGLINSTSDQEQFRHMVAWYIAEDGEPELGNDDLSEYRQNGNIYSKRAVDLGHLCPPRCK